MSGVFPVGSIQRLQQELRGLCSHSWVVPVKVWDDGALELDYPEDITTDEEIRATRGSILARMVFCRFCEAKLEGGK